MAISVTVLRPFLVEHLHVASVGQTILLPEARAQTLMAQNLVEAVAPVTAAAKSQTRASNKRAAVSDD